MVEQNELDCKAKILINNEENIKHCAERLINGKLVSFATETVYGLGANCFNKDAVLDIFKYKGRPLSDPLILHVHSIEQIFPLVDIDSDMKDLVLELNKHFWPGPLTIILKANKEKITNYITAGTEFVSFRIPNHPDALKLLKKVSFPVAAPSANKFCHVSPVTAQHVYSDFINHDVNIIDSGKCKFSMESTVIKPNVENKTITIYRKGALTEEDFKKVLTDYSVNYYIKLQDHKLHDINDDIKENQECPGQFIKHYSPLIPTYIFDFLSQNKIEKEAITKSVIIDFNEQIKSLIDKDFKPLKFLDLSSNGATDEALTNLYDFLRQAEEIKNAEFIILPDLKKILDNNDKYKLIMVDRIEKASSGNTISL